MALLRSPQSRVRSETRAIATNAILENKGSRVGVLVPEGFKYVLEIGRHGTPRLVNPNSWIKPQRPVRPRDIEEISERVSSDGEVLIPLDETAVRDEMFDN